MMAPEGFMRRSVIYYLALTSPWAYFGGPRLIDMARRLAVDIDVKPVDFAKVMAASGGIPLAKRAAQRQVYRLVELDRWRRRLGMKLNLEPAHFPVPDGLAGAVVIAAAKAGADPLRISQAILTAIWAEDRNIADAGTLAAILGECGLDPHPIMAIAYDPDTRFAREANTAEAIGQGVFGVPTYVHGSELFWGQDRLDFLERALSA
jgi:2-hydroxychromene-2-carboxylate isomerase